MKKRDILCLLIGFSSFMPAMVLNGENTRNSPDKEQWKFQNFGQKADGKMVVEGQKMTISTSHTLHCFFEDDSYSFAWQNQSFPYDDCSKSSVSVSVDRFAAGSAGIMMRSSEKTNAANTHLEISSTGELFLFFRKTDGVATSYKRLGKISFPAEIKLVRQGNVFFGYYKDEKGEWIKGVTSVTAEVGAKPLVGFYACSGEEAQIGYSIDSERKMAVTFSHWNVDYKENYIPEEKNYTDKMPVKEGTLLRDNFDDGCMSNTPESISNPVWKGIKYAEIPYNKDGGRYWKKTGDGMYLLGDKKWADYKVSIDLSFNKDLPSSNEFAMELRYQHISIYEKLLRYYGVGFRNGNKLFFEKHDADKITISEERTIPDYTNGTKHNMCVKLLDNKYQVFLDGQMMIEGTDLTDPITYGNMALKFSNTSVNIDELDVMKINDPVNGDRDNYLLDYFDTPIPAYISKYGF